MAKNNLGQPTISDVVTLFCDPCNAVLCAGCPINDILQAEKLPNKVLQRTAEPLKTTVGRLPQEKEKNMPANAYLWNEQYPEGTPVKVRRDNGEVFKTVTRSEAWVDVNGIQVIMVKGIAGYYRLDCVTPNKHVQADAVPASESAG